MKRAARISIGALFLFDGISAFLSPTEYPRRLEAGAPIIDDMLDYFSERPELTRRIAATEVVMGLWLVLC